MSNEAIARPDPALVTAYDRYAAIARHREMLCADPCSTATQRFDAALAVHKAFQEFLMTNPKPSASVL